jgi:hypothetical protein
MALIPQHYIDSVVAIGVEHSKEQYSWIGTGFLYGELLTKTADLRNTYTPYLVTNKHVLENLDKIVVKFNPQNDQASKDYPLPLKNKDGSLRWTGHPSAEVDVAVIEINLQYIIDEGMKFKFFQSDKNVLTSSEMFKEGLSEGDFIYVLGFPMGILSSDRQYVFARSGIISRIKDLYENRSKDFVVDAFVFPGNSGGPVISKIESNTLKGTKAINKARLIGIIKAYIPYKDVAYSSQTKKPRITFEENSGLSLVEPVEKITETIILCKKKKQQKK